MNNNKFLLIFLSVLIALTIFPFAFAISPTLTSISPSSSSGNINSLINVSSVASFPQQYFFDLSANGNASAGLTLSSALPFICQDFNAPKNFLLDKFAFNSSVDCNFSVSVFENVSSGGKVRNLLMTANNVLAGNPATNVNCIADFEDYILLKDGNYSVCIENKAGANRSIKVDGVNEYYKKSWASIGAGSDLETTQGSAQSASTKILSYFYTPIIDNNKMILKCGSSSGNYNLCSGSSVINNPSCSFINEFEEQTFNSVYCRAFNSINLDENSSEQSFLFHSLINYSNTLTCNPLSNINSCSVDVDAVKVGINNNLKEVIFSLYNFGLNPINVPINLSNSDKSSKNYFIYSSSDGENWTLNETLTFGSTTSNGLQKVWSKDNARYNYSYSEIFAVGQTKYYKLVYEQLPAHWETIGSAVDWVNINPPSRYEETSAGVTHAYDLFQNSSLTKINSYTKKSFPDLTSVDLYTGFYVQFTAYANEDIDLNVGYKVGNTVTATEINITNEPTTFNVSVDPNDNSAQLILITNSNTETQVFISDYAIIPKTYFLTNLELFNRDGSDLLVVLRDGTAKQYISEGTPVLAKTRFYDRELNLSKIIFQTSIDGVVVKTIQKDLSDNDIKDFSFNELLDGVIDYNGSTSLYGGLTALKNITVTAILVNDDDQNVSQQHKEVYFLQYPYFPTDLDFSISALNKKVGTAPSFTLNLSQRRPENLIGFKIIVFDETQSPVSPEYETIIYADELNCSTLINCSKTITVSDWVYEQSANYTLGVGAILTTEEQNFSNMLTYRFTSVLTSYLDLETARILQVFERSDRKYLNTENVPLVLQARATDFQNMRGEFSVFLEVDINNNGDYTSIDRKFYPQKFIYDDVTGYNYWYFNTLFYDDTGGLIGDGNSLRFKAYIVPLKETKENIIAYGLTDKCKVAPADPNLFFSGTFLMNWVGLVNDTIYGCQTPAEQVVSWDSLDAEQILIDNSRVVLALQNHSVFCIRTDKTLTYNTELGDEFICGVLYRKSEQQIDGFKIILGNEYSDYSALPNEKQYIEFEVSQETVMFNDALMLKSALETEFQTDSIDTIGELLYLGFNKLLPVGQGFVDYSSFLAGEGIFIKNVGWDVNLENQLDPRLVSGAFFFKVKGLSVVNQFEFTQNYPELELFDPSYFRRWANEENINLRFKKAKVDVLSSSLKIIERLELVSPLIVYERPKTLPRQADLNKPLKIEPSILKFNFIVDMFSNNQRTGARGYVPIVFSYFPTIPFNFSFPAILEGISEFVRNPLTWFENNWFVILVIVVLLLIVSTIYAGFKRNGGTNITLNNPFERKG